MWNRIDRYYHIRGVLNGLNRADSHCGLCYQSTCEHDVERIAYEDATYELNTFSEIALQEYPGNYLALAKGAVYPAWPVGNEFNERFDYLTYRVVPKIKGGIFGGIVSDDDEIIGYNPDFTTNKVLTRIGKKIARFGAGIYWGYCWKNDFYVIRLFRQNWTEIKRKSMPHVDVTGLTVPDFEDVPYEINGYFYLPMQNSSDEFFQTKYFEI